MTDRTAQYRYLGFISLILGFLTIHWLKPVLLPLVIALFIIAVARPITVWLNTIFSKNVSYTLSFFALIIIIGVFCAIGYLSVAEFTQQLPQYEPQFAALIENFRGFLKTYGLPAPRQLNAEQMQSIATPIIETFYAMLGHVLLIISLVILGLPELVFWDDKLQNCLGKSDSGKWRNAFSEASLSFQKYMSVMTAIGLFAAILTTGFAWVIGLDFALLWGVLAFIMNFIPVLGAILAMIPPIITASMQFSDPTMLWISIGGFTIIQFLMGNVIDPKLQGKFLSMSPLVILMSIAFWSFIWGVPGAFLAVPLTHIMMVTFFQFPNTKHIACLLSEGKGDCAALKGITSL